jgi:hypothetical protein
MYVASAGTNTIDVFNPNHEFLTAIADSEEPCGLAVDAEGDLYVVQKKAGDVVEYKPGLYPFAGTPIYGLPSTIDASGKAAGVVVSPTEGTLWVAEGSRVSAYSSNGTLIEINEQQVVELREANSNNVTGTYRLEFDGEKTVVLTEDSPANHGEETLGGPESVEAALEALPAIGSGNVSVSGGFSQNTVEFKGALADTDVPQISVAEQSVSAGELVGETTRGGFDGHLGEGEFTGAIGVATYKSNLYVEEAATQHVLIYATGFVSGELDLGGMRLEITLTGAQTPAGSFGFDTNGGSLAVDPGNTNPATGECEAVAEQACTAGHLLVYDATRDVVDEFDGSGEYVDQLSSASLNDAAPSAMSVDRSGGPGDGTVYVTAGAGAGAQALAFAPLPAPSRAALGKPPEREDRNICGVAVDSHGDVYTADQTKINVYGPEGRELTSIADSENPCWLAVDAEGDLYVADLGTAVSGDEKVVLYKPNAYPLAAGVTYGAPTTIETLTEPNYIAVDPANGRVFVAHSSKQITEYESAAHGSGLINSHFGSTVFYESVQSVGVYGANGNVYVALHDATVEVLNATGTKLLSAISGAGSPAGPFLSTDLSIAVDQRNGHLIAFDAAKGHVEEYDAAGAFVGEFGSLQNAPHDHQMAVDNSGGPNDGDLYLAYDEPEPGSPDLWTFGPLQYGEAPSTTVSQASGIAGGEATLNGTVDPSGFEVEECKFEYLTDGEYKTNGNTFTGAHTTPCQESPSAIGGGTTAVPVHAQLSGLQLEGRYRFRLTAKNKYGTDSSSAGLFGPPVLRTETAIVLYTEATLRVQVETSGLPTRTYFEYGTSDSYGSVTAEQSLAAGESSVSIEAPIFALKPGAEYHIRAVVENEAGKIDGSDQTFTTLASPPTQTCPNASYRVGYSAQLPECRAYELVTPPDTGLIAPEAQPQMNTWLVPPAGANAGDALTYMTEGPLPGFESNGNIDGLTATRGEDGWNDAVITPGKKEAFEEAGRAQPYLVVMAPDQKYSLWAYSVAEAGYEKPWIQTPAGRTPLGKGELGEDPLAVGDALSDEARHVVFTSSAHLEPEAPPAGTQAVYERSLSGPTRVVSLLPGDVTPGVGDNAKFVAMSEDGSAIVFRLGETLYARRDGVTAPVTSQGAFAGVSNDGTRVLYAAAGLEGTQHDEVPGALWAFEVSTETKVEIASDARFVNVSADGSTVYFISTDRLDAAGHGVPGEDNLYVWNGTQTHLVAIVPPVDLESFDGGAGLLNWVKGLTSGVRASDITRSTPNGEVLVFESHGSLTGQNPDGYSQVYRYDTSAGLVCVSCNPSGTAASANAMLQSTSATTVNAPTNDAVMIPNVTEDGQLVVFESDEALVPQDHDGTRDVYEWQAPGSGGCDQSRGCVALLSSGTSSFNSYLYGMSGDGHDVFIWTYQQLVPGDAKGSPSIYDVRIDGGFPQTEADGCTESECQQPAAGLPSPPTPSTATLHSSADNVPPSAPPTPKLQPLTRARKLAKALKTCHKDKSKAKRRSCEKRARKQFGAEPKPKAKSRKGGE